MDTCIIISGLHEHLAEHIALYVLDHYDKLMGVKVENREDDWAVVIDANKTRMVLGNDYPNVIDLVRLVSQAFVIAYGDGYLDGYNKEYTDALEKTDWRKL